MKSIRAVLKHQWCKFKQEKGMLIFYVLTILALGIFSAFYMNGGQSGLMMMIAFVISVKMS